MECGSLIFTKISGRMPLQLSDFLSSHTNKKLTKGESGGNNPLIFVALNAKESIRSVALTS